MESVVNNFYSGIGGSSSSEEHIFHCQNVNQEQNKHKPLSELDIFDMFYFNDNTVESTCFILK